jgi:hypothetical protein
MSQEQPQRQRAPELCPLCGHHALFFIETHSVAYFECASCDFIFAERSVLADADRGEAIRRYDEAYWRMELGAVRDRCFGPCLGRVAETLLYVRRPVRRFLDIGTGAGTLLDALGAYLPHSKHVFHGVELYPPPEPFRSKHPNYRTGPLTQFTERFDAGCCIEVIEHLTPTMLSSLAGDLAMISEPGALYLFNTGLTAYVKAEDIEYICPVKRGHICIWSVAAARKILCASRLLRPTDTRKDLGIRRRTGALEKRRRRHPRPHLDRAS